MNYFSLHEKIQGPWNIKQLWNLWKLDCAKGNKLCNFK